MKHARIVNRVYSKTQTLREILKTLNQPRCESYVSLEVEHLFPQAGCARSKTSVSQSESEVISLNAGLRIGGSSRSMGCGDRSITFFKEHPSSSQRSPRQEKVADKCREPEHAVKSEAQISTPIREAVTETLMNCHMWITLSQKEVLLDSKLNCTFLKTMNW